MQAIPVGVVGLLAAYVLVLRAYDVRNGVILVASRIVDIHFTLVFLRRRVHDTARELVEVAAGCQQSQVYYLLVTGTIVCDSALEFRFH